MLTTIILDLGESLTRCLFFLAIAYFIYSNWQKTPPGDGRSIMGRDRSGAWHRIDTRTFAFLSLAFAIFWLGGAQRMGA